MTGKSFAGKVAVVTGGSAGIGLSIARAFAREGASVAVVGRTEARLRAAAATIAAETATEPLTIRADVALPPDCERFVAETVERFGAIDILVNNAAHFALVPLLDADPIEAARFLGANVIGPLQASRAFASWAVESSRGGAIVNISSIAAVRPAPGCGLYSASKAALDSLTRTMALEWGPKGMRVNAIAPGHVNTEGVLADFRAGRLNETAMLAHIPAGRIADTDDIAQAALFLCGDGARHILGQVLTVDGGEGF